jgi:hypothetical protein
LTSSRHEQERLGTEIQHVASGQFINAHDFSVKQNITTEMIRRLIAERDLKVLSLDGTTDLHKMDWDHSYIYDPAILQELRKSILKTIRRADEAEW